MVGHLLPDQQPQQTPAPTEIEGAPV
jgi:hypothetical protein